MADPIQLISNFFFYPQQRYYVNAPVHEVLNAIGSISAGNRLWNHPDMELGFINNRIFRLRLTFFSLKIRGLSSWLQGEVISLAENETLIETQRKGSPTLYLLYFIFSVAGLVFLHRYMLLHGTQGHLLTSLILLIGFPYVFAWYKNATDEKMEDNFEGFLNQHFKTGNSHALDENG